MQLPCLQVDTGPDKGFLEETRRLHGQMDRPVLLPSCTSKAYDEQGLILCQLLQRLMKSAGNKCGPQWLRQDWECHLGRGQSQSEAIRGYTVSNTQ